jgi:hypothetical protein
MPVRRRSAGDEDERNRPHERAGDEAQDRD